MCKKTECDIILSVGYACKPAYHLQVNNVRFCANPLDWMMGYSLDTVVHLFKTHAEDFFTDYYEDKNDTMHKRFVDKKNDIISIHYDYLQDEYEKFIGQMLNRFSRIEKVMQCAKNIVFISARRGEISSFEKFLMDISTLYTANLTYINIRHNEKAWRMKSYKKIVNDKMKIFEYEFNDVIADKNDEFWIGNKKLWRKILKKISMTDLHKSILGV